MSEDCQTRQNPDRIGLARCGHSCTYNQGSWPFQILISVDPSKGTLEMETKSVFYDSRPHLKIVIHALQYCQVQVKSMLQSIRQAENYSELDLVVLPHCFDRRLPKVMCAETAFMLRDLDAATLIRCFLNRLSTA